MSYDKKKQNNIDTGCITNRNEKDEKIEFGRFGIDKNLSSLKRNVMNFGLEKDNSFYKTIGN